MRFLTFPYRVIQWMMLTRPIRFTRFGTFYVLFAIGVGAAAVNTGNNLLYLILGVLLGLIVLSGFLSDSGLWGIRASWAPVGSLYAGQKGLLECRLRKGWFPGIAVVMESRWRGMPEQRSFAPWIPARGETVLRVDLTPPRRGYLQLEFCRYATRYPFGLFQKSHGEKRKDQWIVYPRIERLPTAFWEHQGSEFSRTPSNRKGLGSVPLLLRDYRTGDPLRQVDWKLSAKRSHLMIKEMEAETNEGDLFYLEAWPASLAPETLERFISFVASILFSTYERGRPVGFLAPGCRFMPDTSRDHLHRLLEFLALVDPAALADERASLSAAAHIPKAHDVLSLWRSYGR